MAATIYSTATEYIANAITVIRGSVDDIIDVGVYFNLNPNITPAVSDFVSTRLVKPGSPLAQGTNTDVLSLIGPRSGDLALAPGVYQVWVLLRTATEDIIRKVDTLEVR